MRICKPAPTYESYSLPNCWPGPVHLRRWPAPLPDESAAWSTDTCALACTLIEVSANRCGRDTSLTSQQDARRARSVHCSSPCSRLPALAHSGRHQHQSPGEYFNSRPASVTLTQLLPPDATERDRILAHWYSEYLLLAVIAAAQARQFAGVSGHRCRFLLDNLHAWSRTILQPAHSETLGATGISCAVTDTHLPAAPDGEQILRSFGTWWLHTLTGYRSGDGPALPGGDPANRRRTTVGSLSAGIGSSADHYPGFVACYHYSLTRRGSSVRRGSSLIYPIEAHPYG